MDNDYKTCKTCSNQLNYDVGVCLECDTAPMTEAYDVSCTSCSNKYNLVSSNGTCSRKVPANCVAYDDSFSTIPTPIGSSLSSTWPAASPAEVAQCCACEPDHYLWPDRNICTKESDCDFEDGRVKIEPLSLCIVRYDDHTRFTRWYEDESDRLERLAGAQNSACYPIPESYIRPNQNRVRGRPRAVRKNGRARFQFGQGSS